LLDLPPLRTTLMTRPFTPIWLLAVTGLLTIAIAANAFPAPIPPVKLPPVKLPPAHLFGGAPVPWGLGLGVAINNYNPGSPGTTRTTVPSSKLQDALKLVREVRKELADKEHLNLSQSGQKVKTAEKIVTDHDKEAHADKKVKRANELDTVLKELRNAAKQIADHRVDEARKTLDEAANALVVLTGGKAPKKENPKK
jgi:hypothetical protein